MPFITSRFKCQIFMRSLTTSIRRMTDDENSIECDQTIDDQPYNFKENVNAYNMYSYYDIDADCVPHRQIQPIADFKDNCTLPLIQ